MRGGGSTGLETRASPALLSTSGVGLRKSLLHQSLFPLGVRERQTLDLWLLGFPGLPHLRFLRIQSLTCRSGSPIHWPWLRVTMEPSMDCVEKRSFGLQASASPQPAWARGCRKPALTQRNGRGRGEWTVGTLN